MTQPLAPAAVPPACRPTSDPILLRSGPEELERLRAVIAALPVGVALDDDEGRRVLANEAETRLTRLDPGSVQRTARPIRILDASYVLTTTQDVTEQQSQIQELFDKAYIDELTGLPNRGLIDRSTTDLIERAGPGQVFALAFIDIDNFKHINDFYSHAAGDALLVKIAARLSSLLRPSDVLARIGGDEFVLLATPVDDRGTLGDSLGRLSERLKEPFFFDGHEIFASASIGVSLFPQHGRTCDELRRNADCAMYWAKSGTKGGVVVFDDTMSHAATARTLLEQRFRLAIRDRRFTCAFQPKVNIRTHAVTGVEVLLRWRDEQGIIQAPGDFVALAIELGLINEVTFLVLAEAVATLDEIDDVFGPAVTVSINIAARQAVDLAFMTSFCDALAATGQPGRFMVEITEEAFLEKDLFQTAILPKLRAIGVKVSIDDFGVGYSSLAALADITADEVKIDRTFITDIHKRPRSQSILKAIESLAQVLGMEVIAEGVETYEELVWLQASTGIRNAQGYYFSKPILLEQFPKSGFDLGNRSAVAVGRRAAPTRVAAVATR